MSSQKNIYYCDYCKKVMSSIEEVIFVEQVRYRSFCGEKCIIDFFTPLIKHFEKEEYEFRREFKSEEDLKISIKDRERIMEQTLKAPDELWVHGKDLSEEIWYFIKKHEEFENIYMIAATLVFEGHPSFILLETLTKIDSVINFYRRGRNVSDKLSTLGQNGPSSFQGMEGQSGEQNGKKETMIDGLDPQLVDFIERKKSQFLATLLEERKENDISFENFPQYDHFLHDTLEKPDEVYMQEFEEEGNPIPFYIYLKSFQNEGNSFFYVAMCLHYSIDHEAMEETLIPIISFPSRDGDLYLKYKRGTRVEGQSVS